MSSDVLAAAMPEVDLLELTVLPAQGGMLRLVVDHPDGVDHEVCAAVTGALERRGAARGVRGRGLVARAPSRRCARPEHFRRAVGRRVQVRAGGRRRRARSRVPWWSAGDASLRLSLADGIVEIPFSDVRRAHAFEDVEARDDRARIVGAAAATPGRRRRVRWGERQVNREIIEAIKQIEREKGIDSETLLVALEDALLAAYKKTPDAGRVRARRHRPRDRRDAGLPARSCPRARSCGRCRARSR